MKTGILNENYSTTNFIFLEWRDGCIIDFFVISDSKWLKNRNIDTLYANVLIISMVSNILKHLLNNLILELSSERYWNKW